MKIVLILVITTTIFRCEKIDRVDERVFPSFDSDRPDTENNKKRFEEFIGVELTPDVRNIYCFDDAVGADADYMFAFNCSPYTSEKIIAVNGLIVDTINPDNGIFMQSDFDWWDK